MKPEIHVEPVCLDTDNFQPYYPITASFRVYCEAQQDGHGPFPTFEDHLDKALGEIRAEILRMNDEKPLGSISAEQPLEK